ncbi:hypothetical protein EDD16DRAFT_1715964 [Pisolithus croceorrhizus]|nr:hypothetical protein EDD16DRAFT_1715964 [Pisolithus croceorrhizus]
MVEYRHIAMGEGQVEDGEEEITREIIQRKLIVALASLCIVAIAIAIQDTSSQESDNECSSYYSSVVSPDKSYKDHKPASQSGDTYYMRMQRVHLWRDSVAKGTLTPTHLSRVSDFIHAFRHNIIIPFFALEMKDEPFRLVAASQLGGYPSKPWGMSTSILQ